jgi:filamentous hemagglutinin family protein
MKTSLASTAASLTAASAPVSIKADRPQQLQSVTVYFRGRKMVLMQRPQRRLSLLLCHMLRRSMLNLFGTLSRKLPGATKRILSAGALCAMALASATTAYATTTMTPPPANTLPGGYSLQSGNVTDPKVVGNQMTLDIGSNKAIINWNSFSIGSGAGVDFNFLHATSSSSVLNRVTGNDPSQIMGSLTSNGKVFLINAAGILVGAGGKVDVAGFTASTLNISNRNFKSGKLSFHNHQHPAGGDVVIEKDGSIKTGEGGSVYLIGANVDNGGVITSPHGEVLLAAGKSVELVDTGTPGVKINVKGKEGKITNLGQIMAATGTIGFGAALIDNRGMINASSVDKAGGRIFLRASKDLTTSETSTINADGTTGGNVVLYADNSANIDGDVSAVGNVDGKGGKGGYVDTSGKMSLSVMYAPRVGQGGEWYIDPYNVIIVGDSSQYPSDSQMDNGVADDHHGVITANGTSSTIHVGTITTQLNGGTNVTISTGTAGDGGGEAGNITLNGDANIVKTAGGAATLKLDAIGGITISSGASIEDNAGAGGLGLILHAGLGIQNGGTITMGSGNMLADGASFTNSGMLTLGSGTTTLNAGLNATTGVATGAITNTDSGTIAMGSGAVQANGASFTNTGTVKLAGNTLTSISDIDNNSNGTISGTGTISLDTDPQNKHTLFNNAGFAGFGGVIIGADEHTTGTLTVNGNYTQGSTGILQVKVGRGSDGTGTLEADKLAVTGNVNLAGTLKVNGQLQSDNTTYFDGAVVGDKISILSYTGSRTGYFAAQTGNISSMFVNYVLLGANNIGVGYGTPGSNYFSGAVSSDWGDAHNWSGQSVPVTSASVYIDVGSSYSVMHSSAVNDAIQALDIASGSLNITNGGLDVANTASVGGILNVSGGTFSASDLTAATGGTINISGGAVNVDHTTSVGGALNVSGGALTTQGLGVSLGKTMHVSGGTAEVTGTTSVSGTLNVDGTGTLNLDDTLNLPGTLSIGGSATATLAQVTLSSGGAISINGSANATLGPVAFSQGGMISIGGSSTVSLDSLTAQGGDAALSIGDTANVTLMSSCFSSNVSSLTMSGGTFNNANTDFMTGDLSMSGGEIVSAQDTAFTVRNNFSQTGGSITINGNGSFAQSNGDLVLGNIGGNGNLDLTAVQGAIMQRAGTALKANSVNAEATSGITLTNAGNNVTSSFSARNEGGDITSGNISFTNSGTGALALGELSNSSETGDITISTNGTLSTSGDYSITAGGGTVSLTSKGHMSLENYGGINATNINLTTNAGGGDDENYIDVRTVLNASNQVTLDSAGSIYDNIEGNAGIIASSVVATARNGSIFMRNGFVNSIGSFTGSATKGTSNDDGSVSVNNTGEMTVGNVTASGDISLSTMAAGESEFVQSEGGKADMTLTGRLSTTGGNVTLYSDGAIFQTTSTGNGIVANSLDVTATNGISLGAGNNAVSAFTADNSGDSASGDIVFKNTSTGTTTHMLTTGDLTNSAGNISVENTGRMDVNGAVNAPNGSVSLVTHSPLNVNGTVNANGNINFAAGDVNHAAVGDGITISAAVTSATGTVGFSSLNVSLNALVNGPGGINIQAHTVNVTVPPLQQPHIDVTPGVPDPVVVSPTPPIVVNTTTVDQNVASTTNNVNNTVTDQTTPVTTTQTNTLNNTSNQTAGGGDGEFGGSKDDGKGGKGEKSNKPAPICT